MEIEHIKKFFQAKAKAPSPVRDTQGYNYKYATLSQVKSIVDEVCAEFSLGYQQAVRYSADHDVNVLETNIYDLESGEFVLRDTRKLSDGTDQERGSSETYQRRYALLTVFGLAPEDDDGRAASHVTDDSMDELKLAKKRLWNAVSKDEDTANLLLNVEHPEEPAWYDAIGRLWVQLCAYGSDHKADPKVLLEGIRKRTDYRETPQFYAKVKQEFEGE